MRFYTIAKVLSTIQRVELIEKKEFLAGAFDLDYETFIVHVAVLNISFNVSDKVHPSQTAQITHLKADEALIEVSSKYADFADVFLPKLATELSKHTNINNHALELIDN